MQSNGEAPPSYFDISSHPVPSAPTFHGDYKGVPVYEIGLNNIPVSNHQQVPFILNAPLNTISVGRKPVHCICPKCHQQIITSLNFDSGVFTWLMCLLLTVIGCIPCCLIPFCVSSCQDVTHTCPRCLAIIGSHKML